MRFALHRFGNVLWHAQVFGFGFFSKLSGYIFGNVEIESAHLITSTLSIAASTHPIDETQLRKAQSAVCVTASPSVLPGEQPPLVSSLWAGTELRRYSRASLSFLKLTSFAPAGRSGLALVGR